MKTITKKSYITETTYKLSNNLYFTITDHKEHDIVYSLLALDEFMSITLYVHYIDSTPLPIEGKLNGNPIPSQLAREIYENDIKPKLLRTYGRYLEDLTFIFEVFEDGGKYIKQVE